ncbi:MAG: hypothetical protein IAG13_09745, partial [Deltaproteobacteria bacterium]|nr:hypothetical protein [Nannocystaceae bacterium]
SAMRTAVERESSRLVQDARARSGGSDADRDPNRAMQVAYDEAEGITHGDPADDRPISDVVQAAVIGWVTERNTWVHGRGQHVARAMLVVWPGPVPGGDEADRVQSGGQFETAPGAIDPPN